MGCLMMVLYEDGAFTTKKSIMVLIVVGSLPTMTSRVIIPIDYNTFLEKPLSGVGAIFSLLESTFILAKASKNKMSAKFLFYIIILLVV